VAHERAVTRRERIALALLVLAAAWRNRHGTPAAGEPGARSAVLPLTARCATYSRSFPTSCWST